MPTGVYIRTEAYRQKQREVMSRRENPGKNKSEETKRKTGDAQRGKLESDEFKEKCRIRMLGTAFFKGHKQSEKQKAMMRSRVMENHYNWKGRCSSGFNKSKYSVMLRREKIGFTEDIFNKTLEEQNNKCAICEIVFDESKMMFKKSADHCHLRNMPRGILCRKCNLMIGHAKDNINILNKAIEYLKKYEGTA